VSRATPLEIVIVPLEAGGWTWAVRLFGRTTLRRGRCVNVCVAVLEAADALELEAQRGDAELERQALIQGAITAYMDE
jgi:hypothetical protein